MGAGPELLPVRGGWFGWFCFYSFQPTHTAISLPSEFALVIRPEINPKRCQGAGVSFSKCLIFMLNESRESLQHTRALHNFIFLLTKLYKHPIKGKREGNSKPAAITRVTRGRVQTRQEVGGELGSQDVADDPGPHRLLASRCTGTRAGRPRPDPGGAPSESEADPLPNSVLN